MMASCRLRFLPVLPRPPGLLVPCVLLSSETATSLCVPRLRFTLQSSSHNTLVYGCESWAVKATDTRRLSVFHNRCARFILDVSKSEQWNEHLSNAVILERAGLRSVVEMLRTRRLRWLGHVGRMSDDRIPKCVLFGELQKTRPRHGPRKRWRDNIVIDLEERHINDWYSLAEDRRAWRLACNTIQPPKPMSRDFRCHCGRDFRRRQDLTRHSKF
eukprot:scpid56614/ scgid2102/ 